jgi:hypothetical protein
VVTLSVHPVQQLPFMHIPATLPLAQEPLRPLPVQLPFVQLTERQVVELGQAPQVAPLIPQAATVLPGWQFPLWSTQPAQQAPFTQVWPLGHPTHAFPPKPQAVAVLPARQECVVTLSIHPVQQPPFSQVPMTPAVVVQAVPPKKELPPQAPALQVGGV